MNDKDILYAKWLSGEISDEELRRIEGDDALTELKNVVNTVDQWSMPTYNTTSGYEKFKKAHPSKPTKVRKINWFLVGSIAASFLMVIVLLWNTLYTTQEQVLFAEHGQTLEKVLDDGSKIALNDGSTITYNTENWINQRTIELTGEASFEVTKGSPFIVNTANGSIQVLGTQFNVKAWGNHLQVECYEGKVQVNVDLQKTVLTAQEAVHAVKGKMNEKQEITSNVPSWQKGMSRFYGEKLQDVFDELERQYNYKVKMQVKNRSFSGSFQHDNLEGALRNICKPLGLNYTINKDEKTIIIE